MRHCMSTLPTNILRCYIWCSVGRAWVKVVTKSVCRLRFNIILYNSGIPSALLIIIIIIIIFFFFYFLLLLFSLDAGLLAISQYSEGPATGHLDTGFSWFPCVYKQMLRWFPRLQVATTCFSCSPPDLNFVDPYVIFLLSLFHIYVHA